MLFLEIKIVIFLAFLGEEPDEYNDVGVDNQPTRHTHDHRPHSDRSTMVEGQRQGDTQYHQKPCERPAELQKRQRGVIILKREEVVPRVGHGTGHNIGQRRQKENHNHPKRVVVVVEGA